MTERLYTYIPEEGKRKVDLTNVKLHKDPVWGYCLDVTYRIETPEDIQEVNIPKVRLKIAQHAFQIERRIEEMYMSNLGCWADIGFGELELVSKNDHYFTIKTIATKTKEMTLEEIEKKLGHKVKIVNR